jgi:hypothetical protein
VVPQAARPFIAVSLCVSTDERRATPDGTASEHELHEIASDDEDEDRNDRDDHTVPLLAIACIGPNICV